MARTTEPSTTRRDSVCAPFSVSGFRQTNKPRPLLVRVAGRSPAAARHSAATMNLFRLAGDMAHLFSLVVCVRPGRRVLASGAAPWRLPPSPTRYCGCRHRLTHESVAVAASGAAVEDSSHQELCRCASRSPSGEAACAARAVPPGVPPGVQCGPSDAARGRQTGTETSNTVGRVSALAMGGSLPCARPAALRRRV